MSNSKTGGPAFPLHSEIRPALDNEWCGMDLRDYFAAKAMQALIANFETCLVEQGEGPELHIAGNEGGTPDAIATDAYAMASAMLKARGQA